VSLGVSQRTREIGIRRALGASRAAILRLVACRAAALSAAGAAAGAVVFAAFARILSSLLFEVGTNDVASHLTAAGILLLAALAGVLAPLRAAVRVDPAVALRSE
jgi:ABC-type antimicrobial peptide transport system permease subunit